MHARQAANTVHRRLENIRLARKIVELEAALRQLEEAYRRRSVIAWEIPVVWRQIPGLDVYPYI